MPYGKGTYGSKVGRPPKKKVKKVTKVTMKKKKKKQNFKSTTI